jgi:hypothetical protein
MVYPRSKTLSICFAMCLYFVAWNIQRKYIRSYVCVCVCVCVRTCVLACVRACVCVLGAVANITKKNTKRAQLTEYNIMHYKHAITMPQENELRGQTTRFKAFFLPELRD